MKKTITLTLLFAFAIGLMAVTPKVKVAYFNETARNYEASLGFTLPLTVPLVDVLLNKLKEDPNFEVSVFDYEGTSTPATPNTLGVSDPLPTNLDAFDVIVIQESFNGGEAKFKSGGLLHMGTVTKPILFNKTYSFTSGRILPGASPAVGNGAHQFNVLNLKVDPANQNNPLFNGISFDTNGEFKIITVNTNDDGATGTQGISYVRENTGLLKVTQPNNSINAPLAIPSGTLPTTAGNNLVICFNDIPAGSKIGNETSYVTTAGRVITLGIGYPAFIKPNMLTPAGLNLCMNSIYSLAGLTIPTTGVITNVNSVENNKFSYTTTDNHLQLNLGSAQKANVSLYNVSGVLVGQKSVDADIVDFSLNGINKGVYIVKVSGSKVSGAQTIMIK